MVLSPTCLLSRACPCRFTDRSVDVLLPCVTNSFVGANAAVIEHFTNAQRTALPRRRAPYHSWAIWHYYRLPLFQVKSCRLTSFTRGSASRRRLHRCQKAVTILPRARSLKLSSVKVTASLDYRAPLITCAAAHMGRQSAQHQEIFGQGPHISPLLQRI